jgi:hypothetical protein
MKSFAATEMLPTMLALILTAAGTASSIPVSQNVTSATISACSAKMDGKLPYYQPMGFNFSGNVRRYYVAAEVDSWDYAPSRMNLPDVLNAFFAPLTSGRVGQLVGRSDERILSRPNVGIHCVQ